MPEADIVVGIDGSADAERALHWAVDEALRRDACLRAVLVWAAAGPPHERSKPPPATSPEHPRWTAQWMLHDLVEQVRKDEPVARIIERVVFGPPVEMLLAESDDAAMLVLGARGLSGTRRMLAGSVSLACMHGATVPVVVVHGGLPETLLDRPVLVGVDGSAASAEAVSWAVEEATLRRTRLRIVHAWTPLPPIGAVAAAEGLGMEGLGVEAKGAEGKGAEGKGAEGKGAEAPAAQNDALRETAQAILDVSADLAAREGLDTESDLILGGAAHGLVNASVDAQLLVVGARGRGGFAELLLGSTSSQCVMHAACPVAVIRRTAGGRYG